MLFSRVDTESKYKAKNLIDAPVYRGGDALSAQAKMALEAGGLASAGVALLGAALAALWALNGWWLVVRRASENLHRARIELADCGSVPCDGILPVIKIAFTDRPVNSSGICCE